MKKILSLLLVALMIVGMLPLNAIHAHAAAAAGDSVTYTFSSYTAGAQYAKNEEHVLDSDVTVVTNDCHFTTQLRIYSSSTNNGYAVIKCTNNGLTFSGLKLSAGNKADTLNVYGSNDEGVSWTLIQGVSVTSTSYKDYTVNFSANYKWLKLDVAGSNQVRVQNMTLTFAEDSAAEEEQFFNVVFSVPESVESIDTQSVGNQTGIELPEAGVPENGKYDYEFVGWTTEDSWNDTTKPTAIYSAGDTYKPEADVTLTAVYSYQDSSASVTAYVKKSATELKNDDVFAIVSKNSSNAYYAMSNDKGTGSAPAATKVTVDGNQLTDVPADNLKWNVSVSNGNYTFYPNGTTETWLYCTGTNNGVRVGTNANKIFTLDASSGYLKHTGTSRYLGVYNAQDWRCYTTSTTTNIANQTFHFFVESTAAATCYTTTVEVATCNHANATTVTEPATCAKDGSITVTCDCGYTSTTVIPATGEHNYEAVVTAPTCTEDGYTTHTCSVCKDSYTDSATPAVGHNYVDGFCSVCNAEKPASLAGRYYIATIRKEGENYFYMTSDLGTDSKKRYQAVDSGLTELPESITAPENGYVFVLEEIAENGTYYIYAEGVEGENYLGWTSDNTGTLVAKESAKVFTITSLENGTYNIGFDNRLLALNDQTANNYFAFYAGTQKKDLSLIPVVEGGSETPDPDESDPELPVDPPASCEHTNTTAIGEAKDPTCTEAGITAGVKCADCGEIITAQEEIPATGKHTYVDGACSVCQKAEPTAVATLITSADQLVSGKYVMVVNEGYAMGKLEGTWITAVQPVFDGTYMTNAADGVWTLTVGENGTVTIKDSLNVFVQPVSGGKNGITSGEYSWTYSFDEATGTFTFAGVSDTTDVQLASNHDEEYKFRAYKVSTLTGSYASHYTPAFTLYKYIVPVSAEDGANLLANSIEFAYNGMELPATVTVDGADMNVEWSVEATDANAAQIVEGKLVLAPQAAAATYTLTAAVSYNGETAQTSWNGNVLPGTAAAITDGNYIIGNSAATVWTVYSGNYGYIGTTGVTVTDGVATGYTNDNLYVLTANGDGTYTIVDNNGKYVYSTANYDSYNFAAEKPESGADWYLYDNGDGSYYLTNAATGKVASYDSAYNSYGCYADSTKWNTVVLVAAERLEDTLIIEDGTYLIRTDSVAVEALEESKAFGYLNKVDITVAEDGTVDGYMNKHIFTFTKNADGETYTIQDIYGRYVYQTGTYNSFNVSAEKPETGADWKLVDLGNDKAYIKNVATNKTMAYSTQYTSFGAYASISNTDYTAALVLTAAEICIHTDETTETVAPTFSTQGYTQLICAACGEHLGREDYTLALADVKEYNITLGDDISVNFNIAVDSSIADSTTVEIVFNGETEYSGPVPTELINVKVAAAQMGDTISVKFTNGEDSYTKEYSVKKYADTVLAGDYSDVTKQLVTDMLAYGAAAQTYFEYNDKNLVSDGTGAGTETPKADKEMDVRGNAEGVRFYGASLVFENKIAIRYYFVVDDGVELSVECAGDYKMGKANELTYIEIADILPQDLGGDYSITVNGVAVTYSPMNYIARMYAKGGKVAALVKALYNYHLAAVAYAQPAEQ